MFERLPDALGDPVEITIDGERVVARSSDSVAAAMLAAGRPSCRRSAVSAKPRGPFCMMGVCYDCLVTIDGRPGQQACLVPVVPGMRIETRGDSPAAGPGGEA
jgi:D-hydroxyproline dehydrogenase subunit gamma